MGEKQSEREGIVARFVDRETGEVTEISCSGKLEMVTFPEEEKRTTFRSNVNLTEEQLEAIYGGETLKAKPIKAEKNGVWYKVAEIVKTETLYRDGDGNYSLVKSKLSGTCKTDTKLEKKRSRETLTESDARFWALKKFNDAEYFEAFE